MFCSDTGAAAVVVAFVPHLTANQSSICLFVCIEKINGNDEKLGNSPGGTDYSVSHTHRLSGDGTVPSKSLPKILNPHIVKYSTSEMNTIKYFGENFVSA